MDVILLILAKPLDKHGTTPVHITYLPLISVLIFVIVWEIFTHIVGKHFFYSLYLSRYPGRISINAVAIGTEPLTELIFSIGTAVYSACVLTKIQKKNSEK